MALPADIQAILDKLEPEFRRAFQEAIEKVSSAAQLRLIEDALKTGNIDAAIRALQLDSTFYAPLDRMIQEAFWQGGMTVAANVPVLNSPFPGAASFSALMRVTIGRNNGSGNKPET